MYENETEVLSSHEAVIAAVGYTTLVVAKWMIAVRI
jgi:hypothetical protein